ncbi:winged helix-turn-helix domain-containing protein, partial [Staphylococcus epidermidis]|uniref:winged helix-turn-helix domain-containing protein n=1 Tax=Staphylococcus epidermidis TaxID=1282 RepID=UPI0037DA1A39
MNLPPFNRYHSSHQIPKLSTLPIIFITSPNHTIHQLIPIHIPPDHFIHNPFNITLTITNIQPLLPPTYHFTTQLNNLTLDDSHLLLHPPNLKFNQQTIHLTHTQFQIIHTLFHNNPKFLTPNPLIQKCSESQHFIHHNTLPLNITPLPKNLQKLPLTHFIQTNKNLPYPLPHLSISSNQSNLKFIFSSLLLLYSTLYYSSIISPSKHISFLYLFYSF